MKTVFHNPNPSWSPTRSATRRSQTPATRSFIQAHTWQAPALNEPLFDLSDGFQPELGRDVQIKQLRPFAAANPRLWNDFTQEMRATAQLRHPNLVQVYEAHLQDAQPYVILERLSGTTLQQRIAQLWSQRSALSITDACEIVVAMADLVEYAHRRNVRVYSVRPELIVLSDERTPVLTALGSPSLAPMHALPAEELAFLAPEYLAGSVFDRRSDVYSLGVLLALLLTGRLPFDGDAATILMTKRHSHSLPFLEQAISAVLLPEPLLAVLRQATAADPDQRYPSADDFQRDLLVALEQLTTAPIERAPTTSVTPMVQIYTPPVAAAPLVVEQPIEEIVASAAPLNALPMDDPMLLPGMERAEFSAALPYVVLVPLPVVPERPEIVPTAATAIAINNGVRMNAQLWLLLALTLVITIGAALTLG